MSTLQTFFYNDSRLLAVAKWTSIALLLTMWVLSITSIVYGALKLCRAGISQEVRQIVMARHVMSIVFFLIAQMYLQVSCFYVLSNNNAEIPEIDNFTIDFLKIIYGCSGLILPLTRLAEPFFYRLVMQKLKAIKCPCSGSEDETKLELFNDLTFLKRGIRESDLGDRSSEKSSRDAATMASYADFGQADGTEEEEPMMKPLFMELSSSLNVELVYIILKSITQFAYLGASTDTEISQAKKVATLERDGETGDASLRLSQIKVKNSGEW